MAILVVPMYLQRFEVLMSAIWSCNNSGGQHKLGLAYDAGITVKMCKLGTSLHGERCMHICEYMR